MEIEASGVCGTDLHILSSGPRQPATRGVVLGQDFTGVVVVAGPDVTSLR